MMNLAVHLLHFLAIFILLVLGKGKRARFIDAAISLDRRALRLCSPGHSLRHVSLALLASCLFTRYLRFGVISDLEEAIVLHRAALDLRPQGHHNRSVSLKDLANALYSRYSQLGGISDLEEAIVLCRAVLDLCPQGHPRRSASLHSLASLLIIRYQQFGGISGLEEAIVLHRAVLDLCPQGHPSRLASLNGLASALVTRYEQLWGISDLEEAIVLHRAVLDLCPHGHPNWSASLNNLANDLITRYLQFGGISDLEEAIVLHRAALDFFPQGHPNRSASLSNLAIALITRYEQLEGISDLEEAIVLHRAALDLCPKGHPNQSVSLNSLASALVTRYSQLGGISDLEEAIVLHRAALDLCPQDHPNWWMSLNNLANTLHTRYEQLEGISDLEEAIVLHRAALDFFPRGHPNRSASLNNFANVLHSRYLQLEGISDLEEAIVLGKESLDLRPQGHSGWSRSLTSLALYLSTRYRVLMQLDDKEEMFSLYSQLEHVPHVLSSYDLDAARAWVRTAEDFQHPTLLPAYETCLRFLVQHSAILPLLPQNLPVLRKLASSLAVDAFSICLRKNTTTNAVELLEQGRCVFWAQLACLSSPLDEVIASGPAGESLVVEFTRITSLIRNNIVNSSGSDQHERSCHLHFDLQCIITKIRELPGLSQFLLPSLFSDLQRAASGGPVIIVNASKHGCDALVVSVDGDPVHIPLQVTQQDVRDLSKELYELTARAQRDNMGKRLAGFLRKLWDEVVCSIVDNLRAAYPFGTRIWWCPTGEFSTLPLHAAGPFRRGEQNLPQLYISSYTPTLSALIRARRPSSSDLVGGQKHFVAVGQANAVGETELPSVSTELDTIRERVDGFASFTRIDGGKSCIQTVVEGLGKSQWVHLACHGLPEQERPFESAFALQDGHFTIERMLGCESKDAEFAYLSACHTTVGDKESLDEVIHLASAMQFIGFRSVIGTMWAVDDGETNKVVSTFYENMVDESGRLDYTRAAFALNKTMRSVNIPFDQRILYVHIGA